MTETNTGIFTAPNALEYLEREPDMQVQKLAQRLWTVTDGVRRSIFLEGDTSIIAFDTFGTPGAARAYGRAIVQAIPGKPVKTIIYSHDHLDHAGFADDLAPDAEIIADEMCAKVIEMRRAKGQLKPTRRLSGERHEMDIDGARFTLLNPGPTHGTGNMSAWFADEKVLFSSDTILPNARYGLMPDYHIWNFVRFMRGFLDLDWNTFVPGRFEVSNRARFEIGCDFIEAVQEESQRAFAEFVPIWMLDAMQGYVGGKLSERFGSLEGFEEHIGLIAVRVVHHYLMGGWGLEDTPEPGLVLADEVA
jgi:glyoxylase-like metal-dependent hydrolase (beta-lactamase superfamily II)